MSALPVSQAHSNPGAVTFTAGGAFFVLIFLFRFFFCRTPEQGIVTFRCASGSQPEKKASPLCGLHFLLPPLLVDPTGSD